jgi:hypothetical protein
MSVVETIRGLRKMSVADGASATPPPNSVAAYVTRLGGLDGLRTILTKYWRSGKIDMYPQVWLEVHLPEDLVELLTNGIEEALCRGFLDLVRAVDMAVRRAQLLINENITLPLKRDKDRVYWLMQDMEKEEWEGIVDAMNNAFYYE